MAFTGIPSDAAFHTLTNFMPIRRRMGIDAGSIAERVRPSLGIRPSFRNGGKTENLLETFLEMKRGF